MAAWRRGYPGVRGPLGRLAAVVSMRGLIGRIRGDRIAAVAADVAELREIVLTINHLVSEMQPAVQAMSAVVLELNHDVRAGSERALPLFVGYTERLRLDADTAASAVEIIERQLAVLDGRLGAVASTES